MSRGESAGKWRRITSSKSTGAFFALAVIQVISLILLQAKIIGRNVYFVTNDIVPYFGSNGTCSVEDMVYPLTLLFAENLVFLIFHVFEVFFCINVITNRSMISVIAVLILEYGSGIFGILQLSEAEAILGGITDKCAGLAFDTQFGTNEVLHIIATFNFAILFSALTYPLFRQYEWSIYRKISIDEDLIKAYRTRLIFITCLKKVAMFAFLYIVLSIGAILPLIKDSATLSKILFSINFLIQALVLVFAPLAFYGIAEESKPAMISFMIFWIFAFANYGYLLGANGGSAASSGFVFWLWFTIVFLILSVVTFVISIFALRNFGEGLRAAANELKQREHEELLLHKRRVEDLENRDEIWPTTEL